MAAVNRKILILFLFEALMRATANNEYKNCHTKASAETGDENKLEILVRDTNR